MVIKFVDVRTVWSDSSSRTIFLMQDTGSRVDLVFYWMVVSAELAAEIRPTVGDEIYELSAQYPVI